MIPQIDNSIDDTNLVNEVILPSRTYKLSSNYETQIKYGETQNAVGEELALTDTAEVKIKKLDIFGNTRQNSSPSPDNPVDVDIISGDSPIIINNRNLFIPTLTYNDRDIATRNCTIELDNDEFIFTATGSDMYFGYIGSTGTAFSNTYGVLYKVPIEKQISFHITNTIFNKNYIIQYDRNKIILGYQQFNSNSGSITFNDDVAYYSFRIGYGNAVSGSVYKTKIQTEKGLIVNPYESHRSKELPLDLPVENLLNLPDGTYSHNGVTAIVTNGIITLNGTANGTSAINIPINLTIKANQSYTLEANNLEEIGKSGTGEPYACIRFRLSTTDDAVSDVRFNPINNYKTFQKTEETTYVYLRIRTGSGLVYNNYVIKPQLEKGSKINSYTSYDTMPIELCKINDYQNYFYRNNNNWYLHKDLEKINLGDYNWTLSNNTSISNINTNRWFIPYPCNRVTNNSMKTSMSNILPMGSANSTYGQDALGIGQSRSQLIIRMPVEYSTASALKDKLNELDAYAIILLNEPLDILIEDTTLITQLDNLQEIKLYQGLTNIFSSKEIGPILDIDYYPLSSIYYETVQVDRISGFIDDLDAIRQAVYHILSIERYSCLIYDDNYGVELQQYIGQDFEYLKVTIQKTLEEALMQDERIVSIDVIDIEKIDNETANVKLSIQANVGEIQMEVNVNV